jgi:hypothetical protein
VVDWPPPNEKRMLLAAAFMFMRRMGSKRFEFEDDETKLELVARLFVVLVVESVGFSR